jgi:hypothetical protein
MHPRAVPAGFRELSLYLGFFSKAQVSSNTACSALFTAGVPAEIGLDLHNNGVTPLFMLNHARLFFPFPLP